MKKRLCRWGCQRLTERRCGICIECCNERDERNRQIDAGKIKYVPAAELYGTKKPKRAMSEAQKNALAKAKAVKKAVSIAGIAPGGV